MFFDKLKSVVKTPTIEFLCHKEDYGVLPEPFPARKLLPDWFKSLPPKLNKENRFRNSTIKRCPPVLDAMSVGWIIPLCADVEFKTNSDASGVDYQWQFYRTMIENHSKEQISTEEAPNPNDPKPPMKFMNYWAIKVPKGYSILFTPPLNRPDPRFTCISGLVDCDGYFEFVNFPFFFHVPNFIGILPAGTPLVQVIPFKRDALFRDYEARAFTKEEEDHLEFTRRQRRIHESHYRDYVWSRK